MPSLKLVHGIIKNFQISLNWKEILGKPVEIKIDGIILLLQINEFEKTKEKSVN
jgi:uncharacterized membrane protein